MSKKTTARVKYICELDCEKQEDFSSMEEKNRKVWVRIVMACVCIVILYGNYPAVFDKLLPDLLLQFLSEISFRYLLHIILWAWLP